MNKIILYSFLSIVGVIYLTIDVLNNKFSFKGFLILVMIIVVALGFIHSFLRAKK